MIKFTKMQGCGNDYIYINGMTEHISEEKKSLFVRVASDRHFGIGGDGVIFINASDVADFEMEMYNADGTRAEMCGNGIRCVAKYVYDNGFTDKTDLTIVSCNRILSMNLTLKDGKVDIVKVNMGAPDLTAVNIPVLCMEDQAINEPITVLGEEYKMTCVSMGNPHAVIFTDDVTKVDLDTIGPHFETHKRFPLNINTEFVEVINRQTVAMRVWERGAGETLACGTGCCATVVACILNGLTDDTVMVEVLGGRIQITWDRESNQVYMTGAAVTVFEGEIDESFLDQM